MADAAPETPSTCDLSDEHGDAARVVPPVLRHFGGRRVFSGPVVTVRCFEDNSRVKELVQTEGKGRVLVVDGGGSTRTALLGDLLGAAAAKNGWAGVVVHGCVRDAAALAALELGVMALAATPRRSRKNGEGQVDVEIDFAGVAIRPADVLFADDDGVVVLPPDLVRTADR